MNKLVIKKTKRYGYGVFSEVDLKAGSVVYKLSGKRIDINDLVNYMLLSKDSVDNPLQIGRRTHILLNKISKSFNHSCDPNCGIKKNTELIALRDILKGEELTYDYSLTVAPTKWKMKCKCSSKNCRKIIGDVLSIPKKRLVFYKKFGAIQEYMKRILKIIELGKYHIPRYEINAIKKLNNSKHS